MKQNATIYRMVTPDHLCPWGLKALSILKRKGFSIKDRHLKSTEENASYKKENAVSETPQIYIEGEHIGGYEDLRSHLGMSPEESEGTTYQPIIAIFAVTFLMALSTAFVTPSENYAVQLLENFIAFSMCVLAIMKLRDLSAFSTQFLSYDLLARRWVPYAYIYPFIEMGAGVLMIGNFVSALSIPGAFFIGSVGAISVIKAVYIDKRELKCACVGGGSNVPLGFISLTENLMMVAMAVWMFTKQL